MNRKTLYITAAVLSFLLGVGLSRVSYLIDDAEERMANWIVTTPALESPDPPRVVGKDRLRERQREQNEIYRTVIHEMFVSEDTKLVVIEGQTTNFPLPEDDEVAKGSGQSEDFFGSIRSSMPTIDAATLADYSSNNMASVELVVSDLGIDYVLVTEKDLRPLFPRREYDRQWTRFYDKYPNSSGVLSFSQIGFNLQHDQAFLYAGRSCGGLCGQGSYVFLKKHGASWRIEKQEPLWAS